MDFDSDSATTKPKLIPYEFSRTVLLVELFYNLLACPFVLAFCIAILKQRIFHVNLIALLMNVQITYLICLLSRLALTLMNLDIILSNLMSIILTIYNEGMLSLAIAMVSIIIERTAATLMVRTYEKFCPKIPYFGLGIIAGQWIASISIMLAFPGQVTPSKVIPLIIYACNGTAVLVFLCLPYISQRIVQKQKGNHSLSSRYQSLENMRSSHLLRANIAIIGILSNIGNTCVLLTFIVPKHEATICIFIFGITLPTQAVLQAVVSFCISPNLLEGLLKFLVGKNVKVTICNRVTSGPKSAANVVTDGKLYFEIFNKAWR